MMAPQLRKFENFKSVALMHAELNNYDYSEKQGKLINYKLKKKKFLNKLNN